MKGVQGELGIPLQEGEGELPLAIFAEKYGEAGLRNRFQQRLGEAGIKGCDYDLVSRSAKLGLAIHAGSKPRTYEPYVNHILRVSLRVIEQLGVLDPEIVSGSMLHDTIEMHPGHVIRYVTGEDYHHSNEERVRTLALYAMAHFTTPLTSYYVSDVTAPRRRPEDNRVQVYRDYTRDILTEGLPGSKVIKTADFIDNATPPSKGESAEKRAWLDKKQLGVYQLYLDSLNQNDTLISDQHRADIRALLEEARDAAQSRSY